MRLFVQYDDDYKFYAEVSKEPSEYGIDLSDEGGGRITSLDVRYKDELICRYDEDWEFLPPFEHLEVVSDFVNLYN